MTGPVKSVPRYTQSPAITHSRENRMPAQIAEVIARGYIPQELKKRDFMRRTESDSQVSHSTKSILSLRDESLQNQHRAGRIFDAWRRMGNEGLDLHRKATTNGE